MSKISFFQVPATAEAGKVAPSAVLWGCRLSIAERQHLHEQSASSSIDELWLPLADAWSGKSKQDLRSHPVAEAYCRFYQSIGLNPKDYPPSAMNLVQRFLLKWQPGKVRRINPLVDAANVASAETLVPIALLNAAGLAGDLQLDLSREGECFQGFGQDAPYAVTAGTLVLRDSEKVVSLFGYRDGQATAVSTSTTDLCLLACQVQGVATEHVQDALNKVVSVLDRHYVVTAH